jgi:hypothetical protein
LLNSSRSEIPEFNPAPDVAHRNSVEQYFVGVRVSSAHEEIRCSAPRAGLQNLKTWNQAKWLKHVQLFRGGHVANDREHCTHL